jgi:hypothetical protein
MGTQRQPREIEPSIMIPGLFACAVFLGAMLLFLLEPYVGKSLLPLFGGSPAVWNTCVFFFQFMLLAGYGYVYLINRYLSIRAQMMVHALVIAAAALMLPLHFSTVAAAQASNQPIATLIGILALSSGLPFLVTSTTAPLLQAWYARARSRSSPYWLYVASNAGSLAALIAYPALVEDWLPLTTQSSYWTQSFFVFALLVLACGWFAYQYPQGTSSARLDSPPPGEDVTLRQRLSWLALSLCPSSMMLGVTIYLTSQIAPIPLLWIFPLAVYLLSFMIAFANPAGWLVRLSVIAYVVLAGVVFFAPLLRHEPHLLALFHVTLLFFGATALHCHLARLRPASAHLTEFYLWISLGGLCGGIFSSLLAPLMFNWLAEYPLAIVLGLLLVPWPFTRFRPGLGIRGALRFTIAAAVLLGLSWKVYFSQETRYVMHRERTFFGPFTVLKGTGGAVHVLIHGTIPHGMQNCIDIEARRAPLAYYFSSGPIGQLFNRYRGTEIARSVGIVGLGIGTLASYGEPDQEYTFYEIDPAIERVARNPRWFTFLKDAEARNVKVNVKIGDARLSLHDAPDQAYGILVLDAFTSDAIPVHLLTREAVSLYLSKLKPHGLLAFHISNLYVDVEPVLSNIAADLGLAAWIQTDDLISKEEQQLGKFSSTWLVMAPAREDLKALLANGRWRPCKTRPDFGVWTDDRSNLLRALRWRKK